MIRQSTFKKRASWLSNRSIAGVHTGLDGVLDRLRHYRFCDRWHVSGNIETVAAAMRRPEHIPHWWSCFRHVDIENVGTHHGQDYEFVARIKGIMPYVLKLTLHIDDVDFPHKFHTFVSGDLIGSGSGRLMQVGNRVQIDFQLDVRVVRRSLRLMYSFLYPLGFVQHSWVMRTGERGLRKQML